MPNFETKTMKTIYLMIFTFAAVVSFGQCDSFIQVNHDPMEGFTIRAFNEPLNIDDKMLVYAQKYEGVITLKISPIQAGCIAKDQRVIYLFENGEILTLRNNSGFRCDGITAHYFGKAFGRMNAYRKLSSNNIVAIRAYTYKSYVDVSLTPEQSKRLRSSLECLNKQ